MTVELDNAMRRQVFSLPALIKEQYADLEPKTRKVLSTPEIFGIQRIVLTGCGDSYAAALAMKHVIELLTEIPTEVVPVIDLARYYHPKQMGFAPLNPLVIAISNSGGVARVDEAVQYVNKHGAFTLGITGNTESPLGKNASRMLKLDIPAFESAPGIRSYMVSVLSLLLLGIRIGEVRGKYTMDTATLYREDILNQANELERLFPEMDEKILRTAKAWKDFPVFDFVGAGFDYAAAFYGHAKILEATGRAAMHVNAEEWLHLNFFARDTAHIGTVMIANTTNPAISRARETVQYGAKLGRPMLVITDGNEAFFGVPAEYVKVPKTQTQINMPLTQFVPTALLAGYLSELMGEEYGRGCVDNWNFCEGGACVRQSEIIVR